jgi:Ca-activated chloride channel family protein
MLSFAHPIYLWWLLGIIPLAFLFYALLKWKKTVARSLGDKKLVARLLRYYDARKFKLKFYLVFVALALVILAAAGLRSPSDEGQEKSAGIDIIVALDVSKSMLSQDIKPTRLDRAKQLIRSLAAGLGNNRVGLEVFAGQAILQMPLTSDIGAINMFLPNINTDMVPIQGTAVAQALLTAEAALHSPDKKHKVVILMTDGETHDKGTDAAISKLYASGIAVFTVGIGTPTGSPIFDPTTGQDKKDKDGNVVISKLNEKELKEIASKTGGSYVLLNNDQDAIEQITGRINNMEKKIIVSGNVGSRNFYQYFPVFIALALLLLIADLFLTERKPSRI